MKKDKKIDAFCDLRNLKAALEESSIVSVTDEKGVITYANPKFCEISGYSAVELTGQTHRIVNSGHHSNVFFENLWRTIIGGKTWRGELCNRARDGALYWISTAIVPLTGESGSPNQFVAVSHDITSQKIVEEKLRLNLEQLRLYEKVIVNARDSILITEAEPLDPPGPRIVYANPAFTAMTGYSLGEIIGQTPRILQGPKTDRAKLDRVRKSLEARKPIQVSMTNYRKDGTDFEVEFDIVPVADEHGEFTHCISIQRDVTERRYVEQMVEEKNLLLDQSYDAIFIWNIDDGITYWHPNSATLFGFAADEAIGREAHKLLKTVYPKSIQEFIRELRERGSWEGETVHLTKTNTEVIAEARLQVIRKMDENLIVLETLHDVTEKRRMELNLARTSQLALIGELAAGLAHEIKNPLAGIKGVIDIMLLEKESVGDDDGEILGSVRYEIDRIDRTVRALLEHSRPRPIEIQPFPLDETIRRAVRLAAYQPRNGNLNGGAPALKLFLPDDGVIVPHDTEGIEDVVLNLIINARDAIAEKEDGWISIRLSIAENETGMDCAEIQVEDNGCGIPPERIGNIFNPFQSSKENGTGLGLASVRRIVRGHRGECDVQSDVGCGTTFTIRLPLDRVEEPVD